MSNSSKSPRLFGDYVLFNERKLVLSYMFDVVMSPLHVT